MGQKCNSGNLSQPCQKTLVSPNTKEVSIETLQISTLTYVFCFRTATSFLLFNLQMAHDLHISPKCT